MRQGESTPPRAVADHGGGVPLSAGGSSGLETPRGNRRHWAQPGWTAVVFTGGHFPKHAAVALSKARFYGGL